MRKQRAVASNWSIISLGLIILGLVAWMFFNREAAHRFVTEAFGKKANLVVVVSSELGELRKPWKYLAQGGEDLSRNMLSEVKDKIRVLSPEAIRIDHIYDGYEVVSRDKSGKLLFDWSRLDEVVGTILDIGSIPTLVLSYMPPAISTGDVIDAPREWSEWSLVVERTIEHYSGDLGIENIVYEVWNEPDLFGGWDTGGDKSYLDLYEWAIKGSESAEGVKEFMIGGPGTTGANDDFMDDFISFIQEKDLRLDFISWHQYNKDLEVYVKDFAVVNGVLSKHPELMREGMNYFITEIGPTGDVDESYDSKLAAAHTVAIIRQTMEKAKRLYSFEIVDGKDPNGKEYWGRWGILTHPDFGANEKPRYKVLEYLNQLFGNRLTVFGEGTWVKAIATKEKDGNIKVLLVNYDQHDKHTEEVPITFEGIPEGKYKIVNELLGGGRDEQDVVVSSLRRFKTSVSMPQNGVLLLTAVKSES